MGRRAADAPLEGTPASTSGNDLGLFKPSTSLAKKLRKVIHLKEDATTIRKASKSSLTEKQKDRNFNDVRRGLCKSWEVAVTNQLLNSGKVVICRFNEEFLDRMVEDEYANDPSKSKEEIRQELINEGLDWGTNALYDEKTGKVYINGENVDEGEAGAVLAYEIGVHAAKDSEFNELIGGIENRVEVLMKKGLKSKKPAERRFWEDVKRRMDGARVSNNEERLVYFLEVYTKRNDVVPQSERSVFDQIAGVLKNGFSWY